MPARRFLSISFLLLLVVGGVFGQTPAVADQSKTDQAVKEKQERERKLLEEILADAANLRLPENRAYVYARVGSALWQSDEKTARRLFQEAVAELIAGQTEAANEKVSSRPFFQALIYGQMPRQDIINFIAARDAALALDYLEKSRPAPIAEAMQALRNDDTSTLQQFARGEIMLEQRLLGLAAEQNPQLLAKRLRESIKRGASYETINLLKRVYAKDPEIADSLTAEVAESFLKLDYARYSPSIDTACLFVNEFGKQPSANEKGLKLPQELLRRLLLRMTDGWLDPKNPQPYGYWNCTASVEKILPERAAELKKKIAATNYQGPTEEAQRYSKLLSSPEATPEEMIAEVDKFQPSYRNEIYRAAANKYAVKGNFAEAERLIRSTVTDEQTEYYLTQFFVNTAYQLAGQGKFAEAGNFINRITDEYQRINALINLANSAYGLNPKENLKIAEGYLGEARALLSENFETQNDLNAAITLATAYANVNESASFQLIEAILPSLNELIQANLTMMKFRTYGGMRQGEVQLVGGSGLGVYGLENTLRMLREKDFDRTRLFTNGFARLEIRLWLRLQLISENSPPVNQGIITRRSFVSGQ